MVSYWSRQDCGRGRDATRSLCVAVKNGVERVATSASAARDTESDQAGPAAGYSAAARSSSAFIWPVAIFFHIRKSARSDQSG